VPEAAETELWRHRTVMGDQLPDLSRTPQTGSFVVKLVRDGETARPTLAGTMPRLPAAA
jgi:hypothetical protein